MCARPRDFQLIDHFRQMVKKYERGDLPKCDWLDNLTFRKMASIHAVNLPSLTAAHYSCFPSQEETQKSDNLYLYIDLPRFDFPVIFSEPVSALRRFAILKLTWRRTSQIGRQPRQRSSYQPQALQDLRYPPRSRLTRTFGPSLTQKWRERILWRTNTVA